MKRVKLNKEKVKALFDDCDHQADVLIGIYRMVYPEYDFIEAFDGWPRINPETSKEISMMFMAFDEVHHPDVMMGGLWMNCGFSSCGDECKILPKWTVEPCGFTWNKKVLPLAA